MINGLICELVSYGMQNGLVDPADEVLTVNRLLELFRLNEYQKPSKVEVIRSVNEILEEHHL